MSEQAQEPDSVQGTSSQELRDVVLQEGLSPRRAAYLANALEAEGNYLGALRALERSVQLRRQPARERHLIQLRYAAYPELDHSCHPADWPPVPDRETAEGIQSPQLPPESLSVGRVAAAIRRYGFVWIPQLIPPTRTAWLRKRVDDLYDARDAYRAGAGKQMDFFPQALPSDTKKKASFTGQKATIRMRDAPRALYEYFQTLRELGLMELLSRYLGAPPVLAAEKATFRRVPPDGIGTWHQDGAFMGTDVRPMNVWTALSDCGADAPGLEVIPRRLDRIVPTGEYDTPFTWTVASKTIERELPGVESRRPHFSAGDVLLFDHLCLHSTAGAPSTMTKTRYAIESWFFAASHKGSYTPLVV